MFAIDVDELRERAAKRIASVASPANPASADRADLSGASKLATLATLAGPESIPEAPTLTWSDRDIQRFLGRRARLMRWGWTEAEAETLAEKLTRRDREFDDRVSCIDCCHYRTGKCGSHVKAGLASADVGRDFVSLLQRCNGFEE
jgi:hypothetical protein